MSDHMPADPHYDRAPITEAVLEIVFAERISDSDVEKVKKKLAGNYAFEDAEIGMAFNLNPVTGSGVGTPEWKAAKLSSLDRANISIIKNPAFSVSRLAPYTDWTDFNGRMRRDWEIVENIIGRRDVSRVGLRYINRIDVPAPRNAPVDVADYLTILPSMPELHLGEMSHYVMQIQRHTEDGQFLISINTGKMDSPLIGHKSFLLDIDVIRQKELPTKTEDLWDMVDKMRTHKNEIFNGCVTEEAKSLFK